MFHFFAVNGFDKAPIGKQVSSSLHCLWSTPSKSSNNLKGNTLVDDKGLKCVSKEGKGEKD